jgi:hypothetical protein
MRRPRLLSDLKIDHAHGPSIVAWGIEKVVRHGYLCVKTQSTSIGVMALVAVDGRLRLAACR